MLSVYNNLINKERNANCGVPVEIVNALVCLKSSRPSISKKKNRKPLISTVTEGVKDENWLKEREDRIKEMIEREERRTK